MRAAWRSTGSLFPTALALGLGAALSAWCIALIISVTSLRTELESHVRFLGAIEGLRGIMIDLNKIAFGEPALQGSGDPVAQWSARMDLVEKRIEEIGPYEELPELAAIQLSLVQTAIDLVDKTGRAFIATSPDDPEWRALESNFLHDQHVAHEAFSNAVREIRSESGIISAALGRRLGQLYSLAMLSLMTVFVLVLALRRARHTENELRRSSDALRESEHRFRSAFEDTAVGMAMVGTSGRFLRVNEAFATLLGYSADELTGMTYHELTHPEDLEVSTELVGKILNGERREFTIEKRYIHRDRRVLWALTSVAPVLDAEGRPIRLLAEMQDITELKAAERELQEAKSRLEQRVAERTADLTEINRKLEVEVTERRRAVKVQRGHNRVLERLTAGASLPDVLALLVETCEDVYPDMLCSVLLLDRDKNRLRHGAAPSLPDDYNEAIDGLEIGDGVGACGTAAYTGERTIIEDALAHPYMAEFRELSKRAGIRALWSEPIRSSSGEILGTFAMYFREPRAPDEAMLEFIRSAAYLAGIAIERKRAEAELSESQARLHMANRLASLGTLTAGLGHDINNILFPFRMSLRNQDWIDLPPRHRQLLDSARDMVDQLQELCNGLRMFAVDPDDDEAAVAATTLPGWWLRVQSLMGKMVAENVRITTSFPEDLPRVAVPPHRLTQAVMNLVVNAADAMPDGGEVRIRGMHDVKTGAVRLSVADEGTGMTEEVRQRAFDPFFTTKARRLSTGLGLSLVLGLVRRSRGSVNISSSPGKGTTVTMTLPVATDAVKPEFANGPERAAVSVRDRRAANWIARVLESAGYEVALLDNGDPGDSHVWVTEPVARNLAAARAFTAAGPDRRVIAFGRGGSEWEALGAILINDIKNLDAIKAAVHQVSGVSP